MSNSGIAGLNVIKYIKKLYGIVVNGKDKKFSHCIGDTKPDIVLVKTKLIKESRRKNISSLS